MSEVVTGRVVGQQRREIQELYRDHVKYIRNTRLVVAMLAIIPQHPEIHPIEDPEAPITMKSMAKILGSVSVFIAVRDLIREEKAARFASTPMVVSFLIACVEFLFFAYAIRHDRYLAESLYEVYVFPAAPMFVWGLWFWLESLILTGQKELESLKKMSYAMDA